MKACNRIKIDVLQRHIDAGDPGNPEACPIALAVSETLDKLTFPSFVDVNADSVSVDGSGISIGYNIAETSAPARIQQFVEKFDKTEQDRDDGRKVRMPKPFSFYLE